MAQLTDVLETVEPPARRAPRRTPSKALLPYGLLLPALVALALAREGRAHLDDDDLGEHAARRPDDGDPAGP